jgi:hypothetical protein
MQTRRLDREYAKLAATERFRLVIAADAREDDPEIQRLLRTCPQLTYRNRDLNFSTRVESSIAFAHAFLDALHVVKGKLDVVAAAEEGGRTLFTMAADAAEFEAFRLTGVLQPTVRRSVRRQGGQFGEYGAPC